MSPHIPASLQGKPPAPDFEEFTGELTRLINRHSLDAWAETPDHILTEHLVSELRAYRATLTATREWHGWPTLREALGLR